MIVSPNHTSITVADMDRSLAFYRDLLGFEVISERFAPAEFASIVTGIAGASLKVVYVQAGGYRIELIQYVTAQGNILEPNTNRPGSCHIAFNVDDVQSMVGALKQKGIRFKSEPVTVGGGPNKGGRAVYFLDPDGVTLEFIQPPASA
ncbi:MAG: VOC family protein [Chloroflexota bacterium]